MEDESDPEDSKYGDGSKPRKKRLKEPVYVVISINTPSVAAGLHTFLVARYVLDLMSYLKDREDPVKLELALNAAENLIRRKTGVGYDLGKDFPLLKSDLHVYTELFSQRKLRFLWLIVSFHLTILTISRTQIKEDKMRWPLLW